MVSFHKQTCREYLRRRPGDPLFPNNFHSFAGNDSHHLNPDAYARYEGKTTDLIKRPTDPEGIIFKYATWDHSFHALDIMTGLPVGIYVSVPTCIRKRQGIGGRLVAERDHISGGFRSSFLTREGFHGRLSAHALHVTWALLDDLEVPDHVLEEYCFCEGRLQLREKLDCLGNNIAGRFPAADIHGYLRPSN